MLGKYCNLMFLALRFTDTGRVLCCSELDVQIAQSYKWPITVYFTAIKHIAVGKEREAKKHHHHQTKPLCQQGESSQLIHCLVTVCNMAE